MLISTKPKNEAEAAIARARQLTDFKWMPSRDVSTCLISRAPTMYGLTK